MCLSWNVTKAFLDLYILYPRHIDFDGSTSGTASKQHTSTANSQNTSISGPYITEIKYFYSKYLKVYCIDYY